MAPTEAVSDPDTTGVDDGSLDRLAALARAVGATAIAREADAVARRLAAGRLFVVSLGQFKRGKSTLLNALVGDPILPVGVQPVTSVATILRYGPVRRARITFADGRSQDVAVDMLSAYVTEAGNPGNQRGVTAAEVFLPAAILRTGVCLVDTPGIGSVFLHNTATTRRFVPHVDAALVVLGADPPISADELSLASDIVHQVDAFMVVLSKADRTSDADLLEVQTFTERVLADRWPRRASPLLILSAAERVSQGRPTRDWRRLEEWLTRLGSSERASLLEVRHARAIRQLGAELLLEITEQRQALERPLREAERHVAALVAWIGLSDDALRELRYRFAAQVEEFSGTVERHRAQFVECAAETLVPALDRGLVDAPAGGVRLHRHAFDRAHDLARREVEAWYRQIEPAMDDEFRRLTARLAVVANGFLTSLAAVEPALRSLPSLEADGGLDEHRRFCFDGLWTLASPGLRRRLLHLGLPARAGSLARRGARRHLLRLLDANSHRVVGDLRERALEAQRRVEADVRRRLEALHEAAGRGLEQARRARSQGESGVTLALERLDQLEIDVRRLVTDVEMERPNGNARRSGE